MRFSPERPRVAVVAAVVSVALFTGSNDAYADQGPSANDQYRERIPTASGPSSPAPETPAPPAQPLAQATVRKIARHGGRRAALLARVAVSSAYGAPQHRLPPPHIVVTPAPPASPVSVGALTRGVGSADGTRLGALLAALVGITGTLGLAARKPR